MIVTEAGRAVQQQLHAAFLALTELDKHHPQEVRELLTATIATIRSWKPQALLVAEAQEGSRP